MHFDDQKLFALRLAARYHALGMLAISDAAPVYASAMSTYSQHAREYTRLGARLIGNVFPDFPDAMEGIWYQHERPDRTGPHGLGAGEIPKIAGIVALVGAIELLRGEADASSASSYAKNVAAIERGLGTQFDLPVVEAFRRTAPQVFQALGLHVPAPPDSPGAAAATRASDPSPKHSKPAAPVRDSVASPEGLKTAAPSAVAGATPDGRGTASSVPTAAASRKPESLEDLEPLVDREQLSKMIEKITRLRPFSVAVQNVMQIAGNQDSSIDDVGDALMRDQALSIRILKLANSSAYSRGRLVKTVKDAVVRIGIREVRSVIMTFDMFEHFRGAISEHLDARLFSEHSMATGLLAVALARERSAPKPDDYMLWGMLHDVGRLILIENLPKQYVRVLDAAKQLNLPLHVVEPKLLRCDHCDVLREALEHWDFPKDFANPIVNHHRPLDDIRELPSEQAQAAATIALADRLSHALALGQSGNDMIETLDTLVDFLGIDSGRIAQLVTSVCKETQSLKYTMLACTDSAAWPDTIDTLRKQTDAGVVPLYKSAKSDTDAYRMFFERLADLKTNATPTVAILHVRAGGEQERLLRGLGATERRAGADKLPLLFLSAPGVSIDPPPDRPCTVRSTPLRAADLVDSLNTLVTARS